MTTSKIFFIFIISILLFSCGPSKKERAIEKLQMAHDAYEKGDTTLALLKVDSVTILYSEEIQQKENAQKFRKQIYGDILFREQDELDTINSRISKIEKLFSTEKTPYDRYRQYIYKRQDAEKRWNKSYIQVHLDERGELYISSNYYGEKWLNHISLRVYDNDIQSKTDTVPLNSPLNHHSDFLNTKWEKVSYTNGADNGLIKFIAENADRKLKAVFLGSRYYYIILEDYDKQAMKEALKLSKLLKRKKILEKDIKILHEKANLSH